MAFDFYFLARADVHSEPCDAYHIQHFDYRGVDGNLLGISKTYLLHPRSRIGQINIIADSKTCPNASYEFYGVGERPMSPLLRRTNHRHQPQNQRDSHFVRIQRPTKLDPRFQKTVLHFAKRIQEGKWQLSLFLHPFCHFSCI